MHVHASCACGMCMRMRPRRGRRERTRADAPALGRPHDRLRTATPPVISVRVHAPAHTRLAWFTGMRMRILQVREGALPDPSHMHMHMHM